MLVSQAWLKLPLSNVSTTRPAPSSFVLEQRKRRDARIVPANEIVLQKRGIAADTALRLARYFGTIAEMWAGLQADYDLRLVRYQKETEIEGRRGAARRVASGEA